MKKQVYNLGLVALLGVGVLVNAQTQGAVGINTESPNATLEIKPTEANASEDATTKEGLLIPQLSKKRIAKIESPATSTLVYVQGTAYESVNTATDARVAEVDADGFYYYDSTKWVKVGGKGATLQSLAGGIREVKQANAEEWKVPGTFCLIQTTVTTINMPDPSSYTGKILSVNNQSGTKLNYGGAYTPVSASTLQGGKGHLLMSDGKAWYIIGGSY